MVEYGKPIIDTRTTVLGNQPPIRGTQTTPNPGGTSAWHSSTAAPAKNASAGGVSSTAPDEFKGSSNQDLIDFLERKIQENRPLSDADLAKIRRRQKAEGIISGISDAVMSVANLVAAHNYAPNMYNASEGMSAKSKVRFEKEKAEREAKDDKFFNYAMMLGRLRDAEDEKAYQRGRNAMQDDLRQKKEEREAIRAEIDAKKSELQIATMTDKKRAAELMNEIKEKELEYADTYYKNRANRVGSKGVGGSGSGRKYYGSLPDKNGNLVEYYSKADYEAALHEPWRAISSTVEMNTQTKEGEYVAKNMSRDVRRTTGEMAGEAVSGGTSNGGGVKQKKKNPMD